MWHDHKTRHRNGCFPQVGCSSLTQAVHLDQRHGCFTSLLPTHSKPQEATMFANMIQLAAKQGRGKELTKLMTDQSLNVLKQQPGFVEAIALTPETEQDQVVGISIWNNKADADRFTQGQSQKLLESYKALLQAEPTF